MAHTPVTCLLQLASLESVIAKDGECVSHETSSRRLECQLYLKQTEYRVMVKRQALHTRRQNLISSDSTVYWRKRRYWSLTTILRPSHAIPMKYVVTYLHRWQLCVRHSATWRFSWLNEVTIWMQHEPELGKKGEMYEIPERKNERKKERKGMRNDDSKEKIRRQVWCDFDRSSSLICGNKMPTRCNRGFYCRFYRLLNMFRAPLCPSSGVQEYLQWLLPKVFRAVRM